MEPEDQVEIEEAVPTAAPEETPAPSQESDPVQEELDRIENSKRTKKEKLLYTKQRVEKQLAELGETDATDVDLDRPMTVREYEARRMLDARDTAVSLVDSLSEDEKAKELVRYHLENTIRPSGDAQTDLNLALSIVNGVKNRQLAEESARTTRARTAPSAPAAPPRQIGAEPEFSKEEAAVMKGFGLTKEEAAEALKG